MLRWVLPAALALWPALAPAQARAGRQVCTIGPGIAALPGMFLAASSGALIPLFGEVE